MPALDHLVDELAALQRAGLRRQMRAFEGPPSAVVNVDGRPVVNFSSNDYLGLAASPALRQAAHATLETLGTGSVSARLIAGNLAPHRELEARLAAFHGCPAALLFSTGYQANLGVISALAGPGDAVFSDELNHASIIDGCRLSRASVVVYRHGDAEHLRRLLATTPARRRFVVTETAFSMDGDVAPLADLHALARASQAALVVDEAHAVGAMGPAGRGLCAATGVEPDVLVATLSKALASFGAYVTGSKPLIEYLLHRARSFVYTTALPPATCAASLAAVVVCDSAEGRALRERLAANIDRLAAGLRGLGLLRPTAGRTAIFPVHVGDERRAMRACERLLELGVYAQGIRPPTVPRGSSRLRLAVMASHTAGHIDAALQALATLTTEGLLEPQP